MSDATKPAAAVQRRWPRWAKALLVISLAANLAVAGVVAGVLLRGSDGRRPTTNLAIEGFRDIAEAMPKDARADLRAALRDRRGEIRAARTEIRQHNSAFFAALRSEPYSTADVAAVLDARAQTWMALGQTSRTVLLEQIDAMSAAQRHTFADRLEEAMSRRRGPPKPRP